MARIASAARHGEVANGIGHLDSILAQRAARWVHGRIGEAREAGYSWHEGDRGFQINPTAVGARYCRVGARRSVPSARP